MVENSIPGSRTQLHLRNSKTNLTNRFNWSACDQTYRLVWTDEGRWYSKCTRAMCQKWRQSHSDPDRDIFGTRFSKHSNHRSLVVSFRTSVSVAIQLKLDNRKTNIHKLPRIATDSDHLPSMWTTKVLSEFLALYPIAACDQCWESHFSMPV